MKYLVLLVTCVISSGCEISKWSASTPTAIESSPSSDFSAKPLSLIVGSWTGTASATVGESGDLTAIFDTAVDPTSNLNVRLIWYSNSIQAAYRGTAKGNLSNLAIEADLDNPPMGTRCGYTAKASLNAAETEIRGVYTGTGGGVCGTKSGSFVLTRQGGPPCLGGATFTFPVESYVAVFPPNFPAPWYPFSRGPFDFSIPAGTWRVSAMTGDMHSQKGPDGQLFEVVQFPFYGASDNLLATAGPTLDVPDHMDTQFSDLGVVTLSEPATMFKVVHGYAGGPVSEPTHSVYPISLTYGCPK